MKGRKPTDAERKQVKRMLRAYPGNLRAGGCLLLAGQGWNRVCPIDIRDLFTSAATTTKKTAAKTTTKKAAAKKTTKKTAAKKTTTSSSRKK